MVKDEKTDDLKIIKQLMIVQLLRSGVGITEIKKITGMSNNALYKFLPKNLSKEK